jgi:hypothetical protein
LGGDQMALDEGPQLLDGGPIDARGVGPDGAGSTAEPLGGQQRERTLVETLDILGALELQDGPGVGHIVRVDVDGPQDVQLFIERLHQLVQGVAGARP